MSFCLDHILSRISISLLPHYLQTPFPHTHPSLIFPFSKVPLNCLASELRPFPDHFSLYAFSFFFVSTTFCLVFSLPYYPTMYKLLFPYTSLSLVMPLSFRGHLLNHRASELFSFPISPHWMSYCPITFHIVYHLPHYPAFCTVVHFTLPKSSHYPSPIHFTFPRFPYILSHSALPSAPSCTILLPIPPSPLYPVVLAYTPFLALILFYPSPHFSYKILSYTFVRLFTFTIHPLRYVSPSHFLSLTKSSRPSIFP